MERKMMKLSSPSDALKLLEKKEKDIQKDAKKKIRALQKEKKKLAEDAKLAEQMEPWGLIEDVREKCEQILKDANLPHYANTLAKLSQFPKGNYKYQHPIHKDLKTNNRDADWVKIFIGESPVGKHGGVTGTIEQLESTALYSRMAAWKRKRNKKQKVAKTKADLADGGWVETSGKKDASKDVGVG